MEKLSIRDRWKREAGYGDLLRLAIPLIFSTGSISVLLFVDRMFLSWYSEDALAAAVPAGMLNFSLMCFFMGTSLYTGTFVSQYMGANRPERIGPSVGQGCYIALAGGVVLPLFAPFSTEIFALIGHDPEIQVLEAKYFSILNLGAVFFLYNNVFSTFYSGRRKTWIVMWMNILMTVLNTGLDYVFIFGKLGVPEMGISGAAFASLISGAIVTCIYYFLVTQRKYDESYQTRSLWKVDKKLLKRMLKFGTPSGVHFFLDVMGFTIFVLFVGRIGALELTASNIVLQINLVGFLPMIGMGIATTIFVGRYQGAQNSMLAERSFYSALQLAVFHSSAMVAFYLFAPAVLITPFLTEATENAEALKAMSIQLLKFIAAFTFFDTIAILVGAALKGAGDTRFVMKVLAFSSVLILVLPTYLIVEVFNLSVHHAWACATLNLIIVSLIFLMRFRSGKWKTIDVIEK
ncbi:MATE family efflux transporter [Puniceicoccaceae bacterium K14]|nr:MATE family efflux transporter [Puniceicoccaceae bacterium K14]